MKTAAFGLASGLTLVILTLVGVALLNMPKAEGAVAASRFGIARCPVVAVAQDQGYGLAKTAYRHFCSSTDE